MNIKLNFNVDDEVFFTRDLNLSGYGIQSIFVPKGTIATVVQVIDDNYVKIKIKDVVFTIANDILGLNWD